MKSSTSYFWWKFSSEKITLDWVRHGDPEFGTKKFRIRIIWLTAWAGTSKTTIIGRNSLDRDHGIMNTFLQRIEDEEPSSSKMPRKKLPRIWRIEKMLLSRGNTKKTTEDWKNPTQHDQESRTVSPLKTQNLLWSWLNEQLWHTNVLHHALITSSSRKPSHEVGMPRNARENMSIPGNVLDRPHAQRYSDELHNYSRNLATILGILRTEGIEKIVSEEPLQSLPLPCFSVRARRTRLDDKQVLCLWLTMPWVFGLVLKWHDNSELSPLGDASVIPWPNKISEPDREAPSRSLRKGS